MLQKSTKTWKGVWEGVRIPFLHDGYWWRWTSPHRKGIKGKQRKPIKAGIWLLVHINWFFTDPTSTWCSSKKRVAKGSHQLKKKGILWIKFIKRWPPPPVPLLWTPIFYFFLLIFQCKKKTTFPGFLKVFIGSVNTLKAPPEPWKGN